jgi:hypothetical protein
MRNPDQWGPTVSTSGLRKGAVEGNNCQHNTGTRRTGGRSKVGSRRRTDALGIDKSVFRGRGIGEIHSGNPDAESEPSIRWDACQEHRGSRGSTYRVSKGRMHINSKNPETLMEG